MLAAHAPRLAGSVRCALAGTRAPACVRALGSHADSAGTAGSSKVDSQTGSAPPGGAPRGAASPGGPAPRGKEPGPPFAPSQSPLSAYEGPHGGRNGGGDGHGKDSGELSEAERLVDAMQPHVLARGWTSDAVDAALADLGWSPAAVGLLGRSGVLGAPGVLVRRWNRELATSLADRGGDEVAEGEAVERAASAIRQRIEMATPVRSRWSEALQILAQPRNVKASTVSSAELADEIAHYAGYRSPDFSWYTDRGVLAGAFHATEIFWLTDKSLGHTETWRFLARGLRDAHRLRGAASATAGKFGGLADAALATLATLRRSNRNP